MANVTAKKAAVTSATISYKIEEMHNSFKFKYTRLVRRMIRKVKNLQIPVIVPKEILESSDLIAQVYFSVVNVLWYYHVAFREVISERILHHYLSLD